MLVQPDEKVGVHEDAATVVPSVEAKTEVELADEPVGQETTHLK
jgi:hypothetical protein